MKLIAVILLSLLSETVFAQGMSSYWVRIGAFDSGQHRSLHLPVESPRVLEYALGSLPSHIASQAEAAATRPNRVTLALIEKGKVVFSKRRDGVHDASMVVSYSMAKSLTAMMVGYAMCEGHIKDLHERVDQYVPELAGTAYGQSSIKNILNMASGANASGANGDPYLGLTSELRDHRTSYMSNLQKYKESKTRLFKVVKPGDEFDYKNLDTATLMLVVEKATQQPFHIWYEKTLVKGARLGQTSAWSLEKDNRAVAHGLFFASPDDWLRLALHALDAYAGRAGACLQNYMQQAVNDTLPIYNNAEFSRYGYQFWTGATGMNNSVFWMVGYGGQRMGIDPVTERIIVVASAESDPSPFLLFREWIKTKPQP
jgi:CubicO group peptidase (beta-lactamase class C family)